MVIFTMPKKLAKTNIAPIFSMNEEKGGNIRILCSHSITTIKKADFLRLVKLMFKAELSHF